MINKTYTIGIIGNKERASEIKKIFQFLGGTDYYWFDFVHSNIVYYITPIENYISCQFIDSKSSKDLKIYTIDEFYKKYPFIVGERVKSSSGDWYTEIIEMKEIDGEIKYRTTNSGIYYFQSANNFKKCEQYLYTIEELKNTIKILEHLQEQHNKNKEECAVDLYNTILKDINKQIEKQKLGK